MLTPDDKKIVLFHCPKCCEAHWVPEDLAKLSNAGERFAKIKRLYEAEDISEKDYEHWKHIIVAYAVHLAVTGNTCPVGASRWS